MKPAAYWVEKYNLLPHPEGGYYAETYRSSEKISKDALPERFTEDRTFSTGIYFLLEADDFSAFHKIKSDELWFYHDGDSLEIYVLAETGLKTIRLGRNIAAGEVLQAVIPANVWFASKVKDSEGFVFVSCTVAPGFSFEDFELAD